MKRMQFSSVIGSSGLFVVALIGLVVAGGTFFAAFITTQKAKTPDPRVNLRIPVPKIPQRKPLQPLPAIVLPSPVVVPESEIPATESAQSPPPVASASGTPNPVPVL